MASPFDFDNVAARALIGGDQSDVGMGMPAGLRLPRSLPMTEATYNAILAASPARQPRPAPAPAPVPTNTPGFTTSFKRGLGQSVQGVGQIAEDLGWQGNPIKEFGDQVVANNPSGINSLDDIANHPLLAVKEAAGNAASFLVPAGAVGIAGKLAKVGAVGNAVAQTGVAAVPSYGGIREQQKQDGNNAPVDLLNAAAGAGAVGWIEQRFGLNKFLPGGRAAVASTAEREFAKGVAATPLKTGVRDWLVTGMQEGAEELAQNPIEQMASYQNPHDLDKINDTLFGGAMGVLGGLTLGGVAGMQSGMRHNSMANDLKAGRFSDGTTPVDLLRGLEGRDTARYASQFQDEAAAADDFYNQHFQGGIYNETPAQPVAPEFQWQQPAGVTKDDVTAAFNEPVGTVGDKTITAWDAHKAAHPELFAKQQPAPKEKAPSKKQAEATALVVELEQLGAPEDALAVASQMATNLQLGALRKHVKEVKAAMAEPAPVLPETPEQALQRKANGAQAAETSLPAVQEEARQGPPLPAKVEPVALTKKQQPIFDFLKTAIDEGRMDEIIDAQGVFKHTEIGQKLGIAKGSVKSFIKGIEKKLARSYGVTPEELKARLKERAAATRTTEMADVEALGLSPDHQGQAVDEGSLFGNADAGVEQSMGIIESAGGSQSDIGFDPMGATPPGYVDSVEPSDNTKAHAAQEKAAAPALENRLTVLEQVQRADPMAQQVDIDDAAADYDDGLLEGEATFASIPEEKQVQYVKAYLAYLSGKLKAQELARIHGSIVDDTRREASTQSAVEDRPRLEAVQSAVPQRSEGKQPAVLPEPGPVAAKPVVEPAQQSEDTGLTPQSIAAAWNAGVAGSPLPTFTGLSEEYRDYLLAATSEKSLQKRFDEVVQGLLEDRAGETAFSEGSSTRPTTVDKLKSVIKRVFFTPARMDAVVTILPTQAEAVKLGIPDVAQASQKGSKIKGFTHNGKVYLIAENIPDGKELGVFLHEVGVHLGMEKLVGKANMEWLAGKVEEWAKRNDNSIESRIAKAAVERAANSSSENKQEELIAYMVEGLVNEGINPQAAGASQAHQWFRKLWAAAKAALRKLGFKNPNFSGQNLVDLAYGAADLELEGAWHGTAADFRNFNHSYMGSGEGAQFYGWGTYLAQRVGVAREYWKADVGRKSDTRWDWTYDGEVLDPDTTKLSEMAKLLTAIYGAGYVATRSASVAAKTFSLTPEDAKLVADMAAQMDVAKGGQKPTKVTPEGSLMRVASNVRDEEFLDWDKPLDEQSQYVQDAIKQLPEYTLEGAESIDSNATGESLYRQMMKDASEGAFDHWIDPNTGSRELAGISNPKEVASKALDMIGIKGIKFLDRVSRNKQNTTADIEALEDDIVYAQAQINAYRKDESLQKVEPGNTLTNAERLIKGMEAVIADKKSQILKIKNHTTTRNLVIFNDKNIVRVSTQVGASRESSKIKFSESKVGAGSTALPAQTFLDTLHDLFANTKGFFKEAGLGWLTLEQMADVVKSKAVTAYTDVMVAMQQMSKDIVYRASQIDQDWANLTPDASSRLSEVMRTATREQTDPEKGEGTDELKAKYNALPADAKDIYKRTRDYYAQNFKLRQAIMLDAANKAKLAGKSAKEVERLFAKLKGPYFPLMRLGRWYAVGMSDEVKALYDKLEDGTITKDEQKRYDALRKQAKHYRASGFNSRADAVRAARQYQAEFGNGQFNVAEEHIGAAMARLPDLPQVENYLSKDMPAEVRQHIKSMMTQMIFDMLPEHHALKQQMKRQGIHGEEPDMRRVFAQSALSQAHYISRLKHANRLSEAMVQVKKESRGDNETMRMVQNELIKRNALAMDNEQSPIIDRVLQGSYFAHLGMSPAFILTNMTQVPMITAPWLGARYGVGVSGRALATAYSDVVRMMKSTYDKDGLLSELNWKAHLNADESSLFQTLLDRNLLDITIEYDLGSVAQMQNSKVDKYIKLANSPVRITELANRAVTGLAAYRLAKSKGMTNEQATEHAAKAISETQLNYSGLNAPRHMRSVLGSKAAAKLIFQFRKYQQGMIYLVVKNFYDAMKGASPEERRIAKRALLGLFGTTGLMAGALGVPFAGSVLTVATLIGGAFDDDDDPFDAEIEFRNWLADLFGKDAAAVFSKGLPTVLNIDLSKRVGMGDLGSPLPFMRQGKSGSEATGNFLAAAAGPAVGTIATMYDGLVELGKGQYAKAAEKIVPIKLAQNLIRAGRYSADGLTNKNGEVVLPDEKFNAWDIAMRGVGFQPVKEAEYYAANQAVEGAKRAATDTRSSLLREYAQARLKDEPTDDIDAKIADYNSRHPERGLRIDVGSKMRALQTRKKMALERDESGVRADRRTKPFLQEGRFAAGG